MIKRMQKKINLFAVFVLALSIFALAKPQKAEACCWCIPSVGQPDTGWAYTTRQIIRNRITSEFADHRDFIISVWWEDNLLPAMMLMADQLSAVALQQTMIIGTFFDAKQQMKSQQSLQKLAASAHKDYHPSIGLCEFGSNVKSLAASDRKSEYTSVLMSQRAQDRALGQTGMAAATGNDGDKVSRIVQFRTKFCDPADNNNGLYYLCDHDQNFGGDGLVGAHRLKDGHDGSGGESDFEDEPAYDRMNKDIDFARTVATPWTLDIDFSDGEVTENEEEVLALASNLYSHDIFIRPPAQALKDFPGQDVTEMQLAYMKARSALAKQSVAENSYNAITSMKAAGLPGSKDFLKAVLSELGVSDEGDDPTDLSRMLGENPSYYAQMEVLTKKIYQNPDFYTNLYDTPTNVDRKGVALQAIGLMQKFDLFKSYLRNEASLSVLLELAVKDLQEEVDNEINRTLGGGEPAN